MYCEWFFFKWLYMQEASWAPFMADISVMYDVYMMYSVIIIIIFSRKSGILF